MESMVPELVTVADSVAFRVLEASGGERALRSLPHLRFNFGVEGRPPRKHLWKPSTGDYRLEYTRNDTDFVVLFNVQTQEGTAFRNGEVSPNSAALVERAYGAFINDTYWLMMPTKMLDPGVRRSLVPDSSSATHDVLRLTFQDVGLTPGDTYYVWVNKNSGMVDRWHYVLQSGSEQACDWESYEELEGPEGPVRLSSRKACSRWTMMTDGLDTPFAVPEGAFSSPQPLL